MSTSSRDQIGDAFSIREIARAAQASPADVRAAIATAALPRVRGFVAGPDAVRLVRLLAHGRTAAARPVVLSTTPKRRSLSLAFSGALHALLVALLVGASWLGLLRTDQTTVEIKDTSRAHLVFLIEPGPGGGGGGGGLRIPAPPSPLRVKAPVVKKAAVVPAVIKRTPPPIVRPKPVPPVPQPPPPVPQPVARPVPAPDPPKPAPVVVQAPIVPVAADPVDAPGVLTVTPSQSASAGPGTGGGAGTGTGTGLGGGRGAGLGDGSGGGTGGGPYQPGTDIDPPSLLREVRPDYTADARKRAIEGDVALEIVVKRDGTVGTIRVLQTLAGGLEQKAIEAVRQWRFAPARRHGAPVDVVVTVSVGFTLR